MTGTGVCGEIRLELGVYVLGAIEAAGRSAVDAHLACCARCRNELAELAGLPGLPSRVTADEADGLVEDRDDGGGSRHELSPDLGDSPSVHGQAERRLGAMITPMARLDLPGALRSQSACVVTE